MKLATVTQQRFIISLVGLGVSVAAAGYLYMQLDKQGKVLESHITIITESAKREESYVRVQRMVTDTEQEREVLAAAFFPDDSESVGFLSMLETLAPRVGVSFSVLALETVPVVDAPNTRELNMQFRYSGSKEAVLDFSRLLETLPYHSRVDELVLSQSYGEWEGQVSVVVTVSEL